MAREVKWEEDDVQFKGRIVELIGEGFRGDSYVVAVTHVKINGRWAKLSPQIETEIHGVD
jgi:hypothetical protein